MAYLAEALVVKETSVGAGAGNDELRPEETGVFLQLVVVDEAGRWLRYRKLYDFVFLYVYIHMQ